MSVPPPRFTITPRSTSMSPMILSDVPSATDRTEAFFAPVGEMTSPRSVSPGAPA